MTLELDRIFATVEKDDSQASLGDCHRGVTNRDSRRRDWMGGDGDGRRGSRENKKEERERERQEEEEKEAKKKIYREK